MYQVDQLMFCIVLVQMAFHYHFHFERKEDDFYGVKVTHLLRQIRIYITDALNRPVNLNGIPVHLTLLLKKYENNIP